MSNFESESDLNVLYFFWGYVRQGRWAELPRGVQIKLRNSGFVTYEKRNKATMIVRLSDKAKEALHKLGIHKI